MLQSTIEQSKIGRLRFFRRVSLWMQNRNWNGFHATVEEARTAHSSHGFGAGLDLPLTTCTLSRSSLGLSISGGLGAPRRRERRVSKSVIVKKCTKCEQNGNKKNGERLDGGKPGMGSKLETSILGYEGGTNLAARQVDRQEILYARKAYRKCKNIYI